MRSINQAKKSSNITNHNTKVSFNAYLSYQNRFSHLLRNLSVLARRQLVHFLLHLISNLVHRISRATVTITFQRKQLHRQQYLIKSSNSKHIIQFHLIQACKLLLLFNICKEVLSMSSQTNLHNLQPPLIIITTHQLMINFCMKTVMME